MKRPQIIGVSVSDTAAEMAMAIVSVTANSWNSRPRMPPMNSSGMNTATSEMLIEITVKPICRAPGERRLHRRHAPLHVADDVLDHDDRVVDHEADRDGQRHQREIVEREAERTTSPASVPQIDSGTVTPAAMVGISRRMNSSTTSSTRRDR